MLVNPYIFGVVAPPGLLDAYTSNLFGAYGLDLLVSAYSAFAAVRVRRSSDNAEQDIGFSGASFDTVGLASFVGSDSAFVTKWYDQSGANNDIAQTTTGAQPRIVNAGTFDGALVFDGTDDAMPGLTSVPAGTGMTYFAKQTVRSLASTVVLAEHSANYNLSNAIILYYDSSLGKNVASMSGGGVGYSTVSFPMNTSEHVYGWRFDRTQPSGLTQVVEFVDASQVTGTDISTGITPTGNFTTTNWHVASRNETTLYSPLTMKRLAIYKAAKSDADMAAISTALA